MKDEEQAVVLLEDRDRMKFEEISKTIIMQHIDYLCKDWLDLTTTFLPCDCKRSA